MGHEYLVQKYQEYQKELQEFEKQKYVYESKIAEFGETIQKSLSKLSSLGVHLESISNLPNGELDLTDSETVRKILNEVNDVYRKSVDEGMALLSNGK